MTIEAPLPITDAQKKEVMDYLAKKYDLAPEYRLAFEEMTEYLGSALTIRNTRSNGDSTEGSS
jgi:hypothetical protein